ncbi:Alanine--tRNA ligase, mitochondrial, partial [Stegodyphus mimosarum]
MLEIFMDFSFQVEHVMSSHGFVFHHGTVTEGTLKCEQVQMSVNEAHRLACARNHTATHLLNAALRKILPYTMQRSSYVGPEHLRLGFSARRILSTEQVKEIESFVKSCIEQKLKVKRLEMPFDALLDNPKAVVLRGEEYPEIVSVIAVECNRTDGELISLEPCCGTHVHNTADLLDFTVIPSKSFGGATKSLSAVTGMQVSIVRRNSEFLEKEIFQLKTEVDETLQKINVPLDAISAHLKKVKSLTKECHLSNDAPLLKLEEYKDILGEMKLKLNDVINSLSKTDANSVCSISDVPVSPSFRTSEEVLNFFHANNTSPTDDEYKYKFNKEGVIPITAGICAVIENDKITDSVECGLRCQLVLDKTNFYAEGDDQTGDEGVISC